MTGDSDPKTPAGPIPNGPLSARDTDEFGPMAMRAQSRPPDYEQRSSHEQWEIDKRLGILDWDGDPRK